ncbi:DUF6048 family protein [Croceitalea sp. MTPC9]|uniref:DUF6048 family protein n=1 Tax=unclassified Croceitalea TaxID=2632280 RepID=UPI002B3DF695|nr:DUF6048 family protein [Croceitalea sp. MTPC6]GMN16304.1 DUF6048 family protein [Croceitalea sp. MTPC9]
MSRYFTSLFLFFIGLWANAQVNKTVDLNPKDSVEYKQKYGLRIGVDLSRPILSFLDEDYTGLEFVGDYRLKENLFIAAELGNEKRTDTEGVGSTALYNYTTSGSYIKLGFDHNTYGNWYGEQNFVTIGARYAFSTFNQTLNNYRIFNSNRFFNTEEFTDLVTVAEEFDSLNASWLELVVGFKAELFKNIYAGASIRLAYLVSNKEEERFPNLWIPGFNKVTDGSKFGVGYNYSISYFIPLYKKAKKKREETEN